MGNNGTTANVLATIGTICWCVQLSPQIWTNWRRKSTEGLPESMMCLWMVSALPFGVYIVLQRATIPLQVQPQMFGLLAIITYCQTLFYGRRLSARKTVIIGLIAAALTGGLEAMFVLLWRKPADRGAQWPGLISGILATVLFIVGYVPAYVTLWKDNGRVVGIAFFFLAIDSSGALISLLSLVFEDNFSPLSAVLYACVICAESGIVLSHTIWYLRFRPVILQAKRENRDFEELYAEHRKHRKHRNQQQGDDTPEALSLSDSDENRDDLADDAKLKDSQISIHEVNASSPASESSGQSARRAPENDPPNPLQDLPGRWD